MKDDTDMVRIRPDLKYRRKGRRLVHPHQGYGTGILYKYRTLCRRVKKLVYLVSKNVNVFFSSFCQKLLSSAPSVSTVMPVVYRYFLVYGISVHGWIRIYIWAKNCGFCFQYVEREDHPGFVTLTS